MRNKELKSDLISKLWTKETGHACYCEWLFHPTRKWRTDYAFPDLKIAIEIEGGAWSNGRHTRGSGFIKDMEKYNNYTLLGWRLLRFQPKDKNKTSTIDIIKELIKLC